MYVCYKHEKKIHIAWNLTGQNEKRKKKVTPDTKDVDGDIRYRKDRADRGTNAHTQACAWLRTKGVELSRLTGTARLSSV